MVLKAAASLLAISLTVGAAAESPRTDAPTPTADTPAAPPATATSASAPAPDLALNEIIVTAQRRTERLVDVPISIATVSQDEIERAGATSLESLNKLIPGVYLQRDVYGLAPTIRGIGTTMDQSNVSIYIDGVYQP